MEWWRTGGWPRECRPVTRKERSMYIGGGLLVLILVIIILILIF